MSRMTTLEQFLDQAAQSLLDNVPAPDVITFLAQRYKTPSSLETGISHVRKRVLATNARHPSYNDAQLRALMADNEEIAHFLEAPLEEQEQIQRRHKFHKTWTTDQEEALASIQLLPDNVKALIFKVRRVRPHTT